VWAVATEAEGPIAVEAEDAEALGKGVLDQPAVEFSTSASTRPVPLAVDVVYGEERRQYFPTTGAEIPVMAQDESPILRVALFLPEAVLLVVRVTLALRNRAVVAARAGTTRGNSALYTGAILRTGAFDAPLVVAHVGATVLALLVGPVGQPPTPSRASPREDTFLLSVAPGVLPPLLPRCRNVCVRHDISLSQRRSRPPLAACLLTGRGFS